MAALTAYALRRYRPWGASAVQNWRVANGDVVYIGSLVGVPGTSGLTSRRGYATTYRDAQTIQFAGVCSGTNYATRADQDLNRVTGDTTAAPVPEVWTEAGPIVLEQVDGTRFRPNL